VLTGNPGGADPFDNVRSVTQLSSPAVLLDYGIEIGLELVDPGNADSQDARHFASAK
jgi:hypothetical protein